MNNVRILQDSVSPTGQRLTTWVLTYPRFVHAELLTHRTFSRNSSSSRAIPTHKLLQQIVEDPALPQWWGKNQAGMQAEEELSPMQRLRAKRLWLEGKEAMVQLATTFHELGMHKQLANRVVEPWMFITVVVSATSFSNWFRLRNHPAAQPEIKWVAEAMHDAYVASTPVALAAGEWHMPFLPDRAELEAAGYDLDSLKAISAGRVARVSYLNHDQRRDPEADLALSRRLGEHSPPHMSPHEHVAQALSKEQWNAWVQAAMRACEERGDLFNPGLLGNFVGWKQYRKEFLDEHGFYTEKA